MGNESSSNFQSADLVLSEVGGFSGGNMGRVADPQKTQVGATRFAVGVCCRESEGVVVIKTGWGDRRGFSRGRWSKRTFAAVLPGACPRPR
jgi:hypothetical protein